MSVPRIRYRSFLATSALLVAALAVVFGLAIDLPKRPATASAPLVNNQRAYGRSAIIDTYLTEDWSRESISPADRASELLVLRRATLALWGTIPSLEAIRKFESDPRPDRLRRAVDAMLESPRFGTYFAERLSRVWVGVSTEPFLVFRRDRFTSWLANQIHQNRPYDQIVHAVISTDGLWTSEPAANFVTAAIVNDEVVENKLVARTVRGFLGQRIDCAQCHDHPFDDWTQKQFRGLAAFFGQSAVSGQGVVDQPRLFENELEYRIDAQQGKGKTVIEPRVPYLPECLPDSGQRRDRLADWVTHPKNERFARAAVNRIWGLLFGRAYSEPVDDLPDPGASSTVLLDRLGAAFRESEYNIRWLIKQIIFSQAFQRSSRQPGANREDYRRGQTHWAVFPPTRLRPEQVIGSMIQAGRLQSIDQDSNLFARTIKYFRKQDFIREYGDLGERELAPHAGTVPQALLRMNGKLTKELFKANPFNSTGRLAMLAADDESLMELCFLVTLTRRPTAEEQAALMPRFESKKDEQRTKAAEDLLWALINTTEFSWNH